MTTYENAPPPADYVPQPGKHCGALCVDAVCPVCLEYVTPPLVIRGEN